MPIGLVPAIVPVTASPGRMGPTPGVPVEYQIAGAQRDIVGKRRNDVWNGPYHVRKIPVGTVTAGSAYGSHGSQLGIFIK